MCSPGDGEQLYLYSSDRKEFSYGTFSIHLECATYLKSVTAFLLEFFTWGQRGSTSVDKEASFMDCRNPFPTTGCSRPLLRKSPLLPKGTREAVALRGAVLAAPCQTSSFSSVVSPLYSCLLAGMCFPGSVFLLLSNLGLSEEGSGVVFSL